MKKNKLEELVDTSINQTLVRSLITSVTTIVAIIPLFILGGGNQTVYPTTYYWYSSRCGIFNMHCKPYLLSVMSDYRRPKYKGKKSKKAKIKIKE